MKLKVCGMRDTANIVSLAQQVSPDFMGFIFYPSSSRFVSQLSHKTLAALPEHIQKTGVFVNETLNTMQQKAQEYQLQALQLHGNESPDVCEKLRTNYTIIKVFSVSNAFNFNDLLPYQDVCDFYLFDTQTEQHGGSGKTFEWSMLHDYALTKPFWLSGGIAPAHIQAIRQLQAKQPYLYGIDINSRFETAPALKNVAAIQDFKNELLLYIAR